MTKLRDSSLSTGSGTPRPIGAYPANPRPAAPTFDAPRAGDGLATGATGGNYHSAMPAIGVNASPLGTTSGADASTTAQKENGI